MAEFYADTEKSVLSSDCRVYKTERFIKETNHFREIDGFLYKLADGVLLNQELFPSADRKDCGYILKTENGEHGFYFIFGIRAENKSVSEKDIIFIKYEGKDGVARKNDGRLSAYLRQSGFRILSEKTADGVNGTDLARLYRLSLSENVNFPLLNGEQRRIVAIEDQNVLVQGVAGSGKTNVCIDKIIYTACRGYRGRVLYSTFSRGLLTDTHAKIKQFCNNLKRFISDFENGQLIFLDKNHKKAIENRLGAYFPPDGGDNFIEKLGNIIKYLDESVDYFLISDLYSMYVTDTDIYAGEDYFTKKYVKDIKNHQLTGKLDRVSHLSYEVVYKEIYGVIFGCYNPEKPAAMLSFQDYAERRKDSFTRNECEIIYSLARDYDMHIRRNGLTDNNAASRALLENLDKVKKYSLAVLDEVQDMTEINLFLMKSLSSKLFCVGDALQMINPSYFSFAYLKRLLFEKDLTSVAELSNNYRNTKKIAEIVEKLGQINIKQFGTHSFVLRSVSVDSDTPTSAVYVNEPYFLELISDEKFNNYTIIVPDVKEKERLRSFMKKQEILTVAEIKGLERDIVILYNVLSRNLDKWKTLERVTVNRKKADENSVYRYYFNLFYVGVSRARTHLYVAEEENIPLFEELFGGGFVKQPVEDAVLDLLSSSNKLEAEQDEMSERIEQFINLGQYDNARFTAEKIINDEERTELVNRIDVTESFISKGKYREAGIRFWELGMPNYAKRQFELSGDDMLISLLDACADNDARELNIDIISFLPEVENNAEARNLIMRVIEKDLHRLKDAQTVVKNKFKRLKEKTSFKTIENKEVNDNKHG